MNICVECKHCFQKGDNDIWYNFICHHPDVEHEQKMDPVTGKMTYEQHDRWPYCREINTDGSCQLHSPKIATTIKRKLERWWNVK
jgi:hypothetical protein